jgi:GntR family transcriptional repressor for pyruvate dehydrogenase complex
MADEHRQSTADEADAQRASAGAEGGTMFSTVGRDELLSDKVVSQIRDMIMSGQLKAGQKLPSERQLGEEFGVSRTVVREAVRSLAAKGLVESAGRSLRVAAPDREAVAETMRLFLHGRPISYEKVHEVRSMIEVTVAGVAAERATAADIATMDQLCAGLADGGGTNEEATRFDVNFHLALADATQNELYSLLLQSMQDVLTDARRATLQEQGRRTAGAIAHRKILDRVTAGDAEGAREAMRAHLEDSLFAWRRIVGDIAP